MLCDLLLYAGLSCVASTQCKQIRCSAAAGIYTEQCFGLCTPSERTIVGAKLENDGRTITFGLNTPAADAMFPCTQLFSSAIVTQLGASSICAVRQSQLMVQLARDATIMPGAVFGTDAITSGQVVLRDAVSSTPFTSPSSSVVLTPCGNCAGPAVAVMGPQVSGLSQVQALRWWLRLRLLFFACSCKCRGTRACAAQIKDSKNAI